MYSLKCPQLPRPPQNSVPRNRFNNPHCSPVMHTLSDRDVGLIVNLRVLTDQATLHRNMPISELLQYGPQKSLNLRNAVSLYCPNAHVKCEKKPNEVNHSPVDLLSDRPTGRLTPQPSNLIPDCLERRGGSGLLLWPALSPPLQLRNSPRTGTLPLSQPHQQPKPRLTNTVVGSIISTRP